MLIAQISDTHISAPGTKTFSIASMAENLTRCIENINQLVPQPDVVLLTGDVTNAGTSQETKYALQLLSTLKAPLYVIPGNHDTPPTLTEIFNAPAGDYIINDKQVVLIGMDSTNLGKSGGKISTGQAQWLDVQLSQNTTKPVVIFMHHPPIKCSVLESDEDGFIGADLLGNVVSKYTNIERILCGHIHLLVHARWNGTIITTAPSIGMQLGLDLTMEKPSEFLLNSPGYLLHYWTKHKSLITHTVSLEKTEGPYPFEENERN